MNTTDLEKENAVSLVLLLGYPFIIIALIYMGYIVITNDLWDMTTKSGYALVNSFLSFFIGTIMLICRQLQQNRIQKMKDGSE